MAPDDRRKHRRTRLRLRVARVEGLDPPSHQGDFWTSDVSAGGMLFHVPIAWQPRIGTALSFELSIPPGEGYSSSAGKVRGSGKVARSLPESETLAGIAVQFTEPLSLEF
ncbi:MAG: PilZ domain-containing protein [Phycisphaerae bacterium]